MGIQDFLLGVSIGLALVYLAKKFWPSKSTECGSSSCGCAGKPGAMDKLKP